MTRRPREPLSEAEAALAARLRSLHVKAEPGPGVDARVLAAARGPAAAPVATGRRVGWLAPVAVAASLSLAVGLAWRLQPAGAPVADAAPATTMATPPQAPDVAKAREAPAPSPPPPAQSAPAFQDASKAVAASPPAAERPRSPAPPAPPPPPLAPAVESAAADMGVATARAPASPVAAAASSATDSGREQATIADAAPATRQAARSTQAGAREATAFPEDSDEDVPPATVKSPEVRQAWLLRIGELLQDGRVDEARASLAEFRRRYPDAPLPPELRALEP